MEMLGFCFFSEDKALLLEAGKRELAIEVFEQTEDSGSLHPDARVMEQKPRVGLI